MMSHSLLLHSHKQLGYSEKSMFTGFLLTTRLDKMHFFHLHALDIGLSRAKNEFSS